MNKFQVKYTSSKSNKVCSRKVEARNENEAVAKAKAWFGNVEHVLEVTNLDVEAPETTNQVCGKPGCTNFRHVTKSGNVRGYCKACENEASLRSKRKSKMADAGTEVTCCESCMNSVLPVEECVCRCGGEYHGEYHKVTF